MIAAAPATSVNTPTMTMAHLTDRFDIPASWRGFRCIDFGYRNPFVCGWWAVDEDGRLYLYREIYMSQRTVRVHADRIKRLSTGERIAATVADHDASDRATLSENGIQTVAARKNVLSTLFWMLTIRPTAPTRNLPSAASSHSTANWMATPQKPSSNASLSK